MWVPLRLAGRCRSPDVSPAMRKLTLSIALAGVLALPAAARAQATVQFRLDLPVVLPPMVVVSPGVRVVQDVDEEVFYTNGYYWVRRDGGWYRARDCRGDDWYYVQDPRVPPGLTRIPPGQYRRWHGRGPAYRPAPAPARYYAPPPARYYRGGDDDDQGHGHGRGHDHGRGKGHWKHDD